jgi:hypothetical protein
MRRIAISRRTSNGITSRIQSAIEKYGFDETRLVAGKLFKKILLKRRLEAIIKAREKELDYLKRKM